MHRRWDNFSPVMFDVGLPIREDIGIPLKSLG